MIHSLGNFDNEHNQTSSNHLVIMNLITKHVQEILPFMAKGQKNFSFDQELLRYTFLELKGSSFVFILPCLNERKNNGC